MRTWTVPGYSDVAPLGPHTVLSTHVATGARVAITYLPAGEDLDGDRAEEDRAEARRRAELDSPAVVELFEYVESADGTAVVSEFVDGVALSVLMDQGRLRPEAALTVLKGGLLGLVAARAAGLVRCRYAAENVWVDRAGQVKLRPGAHPGSDEGADPGSDEGADPGSDEGADPGSDEGSDVAAAFASFRSCLPRLPRKLRRLADVAAAGAAAPLLEELDVAARSACGADWEARGRTDLARAAARKR